MLNHVSRRLTLPAATIAFAAVISSAEGAAPLRVCATSPDLASLAEEIGGGEVSVTVFAKGPEDPHFIEARPSFVKALSQADLFIQNGMDLEIGWAPALLRNARNADLLPGGPGHLDASRVVDRLEVPGAPVDRSMGDVHPLGNPHYLLDPVNGLRVARLVRDKLAELRPAAAATFRARHESFRKRLGEALVGGALAAKYDAAKLAVLYEHGRLVPFLERNGEAGSLGGWLGAMLPHFGVEAVADHNLWPYFARRFGISMVAFLEPKPGVPPSTAHLRKTIEAMRADEVRLIFAASYYDPRHARFVAEATAAKVLPMAQQTGARAGAEDYLSMLDTNVRLVVSAAGSHR